MAFKVGWRFLLPPKKPWQRSTEAPTKEAIEESPTMNKVLGVPELLEAILLELADGTAVGTRTLLACKRVSRNFKATLERKKFQRALYMAPYPDIDDALCNPLLPPLTTLRTTDALDRSRRHALKIYFHANASKSAVWPRIISFNFGTVNDPVHAMGSWKSMYIHPEDFHIVMVQVVWGHAGAMKRRLTVCERAGMSLGELFDMACSEKIESVEDDPMAFEKTASTAHGFGYWGYENGMYTNTSETNLL